MLSRCLWWWHFLKKYLFNHNGGHCEKCKINRKGFGRYLHLISILRRVGLNCWQRHVFWLCLDFFHIKWNNSFLLLLRLHSKSNEKPLWLSLFELSYASYYRRHSIKPVWMAQRGGHPIKNHVLWLDLIAFLVEQLVQLMLWKWLESCTCP